MDPAAARAASPPAISAEMARVLAAAGLGLREEVVAIVARAPSAGALPVDRERAGAVVVMAGLARKCDDPVYMRAAMHDCARGDAAMVAVLQFYGARTGPGRSEWRSLGNESAVYTFAHCAEQLVAAAKASGGRCELVLGRQYFDEDLHARPRPCAAQSSGANLNVYRTVIQTIALGRAHAWARRFFPRARMYVRARMDGLFCVPPHGALQPDTRKLLVTMEGKHDEVTGTYQLDDQLAVLSADVADIYYGAWRVWSPFNCSNTCYAGGGSNAADAVTLELTRACSGEVALNKWLTGQGVQPTGMLPKLSRSLRRPRAHARRPRRRPINVTDATVATFRARTCPADWLATLRTPRSGPFTCVQRMGMPGEPRDVDFCVLYARNMRRIRCQTAHKNYVCIMQNVHSARARPLPASAPPSRAGREGGRRAASSMGVKNQTRTARPTVGRAL